MPETEETIGMSDEARLQKYLDEHPDDASSRLILVDVLEESGDVYSANFQRWLTKQCKWPDSDLEDFNQNGWHWWSCADTPDNRRSHAVLPGPLCGYMPRGEWLYRTRQEAEAALCRALAEHDKGD